MSRVIVVGAINVDLVISAEKLPAPGETVLGGDLGIFGGGKGANAAVAAARAGAEVFLIGSVGDDDFGQGALESLKKDGVNLDMVAVASEVTTGTALIAVDSKGENQIILGPGANDTLSPDIVGKNLLSFLRQGDIVQISTEIPFEVVSAAAHSAKNAGVRWILNPAPVVPNLWDLFPLGPILTPNEMELVSLVGELEGKLPFGGEQISESLEVLTARSGAPAIATLGAEGCVVRDPKSQGFQSFPVQKSVNVVDTTGAGDTFNGVLAACLSEGRTLTSAVKVAMIAAGLSVTKVGAREGMPLKSEIVEAASTE